jgi:SAM-dependent methyltransferase
MPDQSVTSDTATLAQRLLEIVNASWMSQATCVAAELRIADVLRDRPRTADDLAAATQTDPPSLLRLLRALTTLDICRERDDGTFEMTPMGELLAADAPGSVHAWAIWWGKHLWPVWGQLLYSVRTGKSARKLLMGTDGFKHLENDPDAAALFNRALAELTRLATDSFVRSYDFSGVQRVVDVGGGYGQLLAAILAANPSVTGVLFDLPHALDGAKQSLANANLATRCEFAGGDFFQSVPSGADVYILKSILHDWDDARSRQILQNCRRAMTENARLLIVEQMLPAKLEPSPQHQFIVRSDLNMLVAHAAGERTEATFRAMLAATGFRVNRIMPAGLTFTVIEAMPTPPTPPTPLQ